MRLRAWLLVGAVVAAFAAPASAGTCSWAGCGDVYNRCDSGSSILIVNGWPNYASGVTKKRLDRCHASAEFFRDTDGFYVPTGWKAWDRAYGTFGQGWHKITDAQNLSLYLYR